MSRIRRSITNQIPNNKGGVNQTALDHLVTQRVAGTLTAMDKITKDDENDITQRIATTTCTCSYKDFRSCMQGNFNGTEACIMLDGALTWWNMYTRSVGIDIANETPWSKFKQMIIKKYYTRSEVQKTKAAVWNLKGTKAEETRFEATKIMGTKIKEIKMEEIMVKETKMGIKLVETLASWQIVLMLNERPFPANMVARRVTNDLIAFSGETAPPRYLKFFLSQELAESHHFVNRMPDQDEVHNSLLVAKDAKHSEQSKLVALNEVIAEALEEIETQKANVEILDEVAQLNMVYVMLSLSQCTPMSPLSFMQSLSPLFGMHGPFFILDKLSEVVESPRLADKMKYVFGRSHGEDESFVKLVHDLYFALRIALSKKRRLVAEFEALGEREGTAKPFEHMKEIIAHDAVTLGELETLLAHALVGVMMQ
nr:hypothetical protein [Tanacetum cinerariifolium]